jgi:acetyl-CoA carboxylase biotin carboxyl carrier protein
MKAKEIRDLIDFISQSGLDEVNIETEEFKLSVKKNSGARQETPGSQQRNNDKPSHIKVEANQLSAASSIEETPVPQPIIKDNYISIKSPMIGTFYKSSNPDSEPFIKIGDMVSVGQTVCIIEAMKLFNEIESEISGKVVKILVDNASPVEYDQPLFLVDPS